jgi:hypothetical protein
MVQHVERKAISPGTKNCPEQPTLTYYSHLSVPCIESGESPLDSRESIFRLTGNRRTHYASRGEHRSTPDWSRFAFSRVER